MSIPPQGAGATRKGVQLVVEEALEQLREKLTVCVFPIRKFVSPFVAEGFRPGYLAWDGRYLWHDAENSRRIYRIDVCRRAEPVPTYMWDAPADSPRGFCYHDGYLWLGSDATLRIYKLDPATGAMVASFPSPEEVHPHGLAFDKDGFLWVGAGDKTMKIYKLDPANGNILASFDSYSPLNVGIAWVGDRLFLGHPSLNHLLECIPSGEQMKVLRAYRLPNNDVHGLAYDGSCFWFCDHRTNLIYRGILAPLDPLFELEEDWNKYETSAVGSLSQTTSGTSRIYWTEDVRTGLGGIRFALRKAYASGHVAVFGGITGGGNTTPFELFIDFLDPTGARIMRLPTPFEGRLILDNVDVVRFHVESQYAFHADATNPAQIVYRWLCYMEYRELAWR